MSPDEIAEGLAFEKQLDEMLFTPDGNPRPDGQERLLRFVAVEARYTKLTVGKVRDDFQKLLEDHNARVNSGANCSINEINMGITKDGDLNKVIAKIIYKCVGFGLGGGLIIGILGALFFIGKIQHWW